MPRDLFADTATTRQTPRRSNWTILGSIIAHAAFVAALVIVPIVSALDRFVLHANAPLTFSIPVVVMPASPPAPKSETPVVAPDVKLHAAPLTSSDDQAPREPVFVLGGATPGIPGVGPGSSMGIDLGQPPSPPAPPVAPPAPPVPIRPGGAVLPPERTAYTAPNYPALAKSARIEGTVILEATIDEHGIVRDVRVLRSIPLLDRAAIDAVSQWRYTPTRLNGRAVPVILTVMVSFTLR
jgi:protein TonB